MSASASDCDSDSAVSPGHVQQRMPKTLKQTNPGIRRSTKQNKGWCHAPAVISELGAELRNKDRRGAPQSRKG